MSIQKTSNQKRMAKSLPVTQTHKEYNDVIDIIAFDSIQGAIYTAKKDPISKNTETQKRYVSLQQIVRISSISKKKKKKNGNNTNPMFKWKHLCFGQFS
jgi:hypothetical protein